MVKRVINYRNIEKRDAKKMRERERKEKGTYKSTKVGLSMNSRNEPFYVSERVVTPWKKCERKSKRWGFWSNPVTNEIREDPDDIPPDHISFRWRSNV